ncbi:MAG: hypothetical protein KGV44_14175 [Flavobacteriaceae bacterium]|nr:hypothetical protein [Flavobacteriaceae bacterium]
MNAEIRQNNQSILQGDEISIAMIFNNLIGKNFQGKEYNKYIVFIAFKEMGFEYGTIEFYKNNKLIKKGTIQKHK